MRFNKEELEVLAEIAGITVTEAEMKRPDTTRIALLKAIRDNGIGTGTGGTGLTTTQSTALSALITALNAGKELSDNNYSDEEQAKLTGLNLTWGSITGAIANQTDLKTAFEYKVDKIAGKGLSTNDFDNTYKALVTGAFQKATDTTDSITEGVNHLWLTLSERSKLGYLSGTNSGDETTASILSKIGNGSIISSQYLPSYVDDVIEFAGIANFPITGESGKIYVDTITNITYRWSGSTYTEISASLALGETSVTAYRGDRGKTAYDHSQLADGTNPHLTTFANIASKPTTLGGYGITDAVNMTETQTGIAGDKTFNGNITAKTLVGVWGKINTDLILGNNGTSITGYKLNVFGNSSTAFIKFSNNITGQTATDGLDMGILGDGTAEIRQRENLPIGEYTNNTLRRIVTGGGFHIFNGATAPRAYVVGTVVPRVQIEGTDLATGSLAITRNSPDTSASCLFLGKTRSSAVNGVGLVLDGDFLSAIYFTGSDGTNMINAGALTAKVSGAPSSGNVPVDIAINIGSSNVITARGSDMNVAFLKNAGNAFHKENGFAITSTFATATNLPSVNGEAKFRVTNGLQSALFRVNMNIYSGNSIHYLATGATITTVTANSVFSFRLGDSVLEIKFEPGTGATSFRVASGTITSIDVYRVTETIAPW